MSVGYVYHAPRMGFGVVMRPESFVDFGDMFVCCLPSFLTFLALCGLGALPLPSLFSHFYTFYSYLLVFLSYSLHPFSCFSIPSHSTRVIPLSRLDVIGGKLELNLALVFWCCLYAVCVS